MNIYYTYMYSNPTTNIPFYVGMGTGDRHLQHLKRVNRKSEWDKNNHKNNTIKKILREGSSPIITIIDDNLSRDQASELEMFLISIIGRHNTKTGPLTNMTDGGDGGDTLSAHPNKEAIFKKAKETRGTKVWWNNGTIGVYSEVCPGGYTRGYVPEKAAIMRANRQKGTDITANMYWINDGISSQMINKTDSLPDGWSSGRLNAFSGKRSIAKGKKHYNDGHTSFMLYDTDPRAIGLIPGRLKFRKSS